MVLEYKHMLPKERAIWERFLAKKVLPGPFRYDFRLYTLPPVYRPDWPPWLNKMARELKARRIDAVYEAEDAIWLIEVKPAMIPAAVGELIMARTLYTRQERPTKPIKLLFVTEVEDITARGLFEAQGIQVVVV